MNTYAWTLIKTSNHRHSFPVSRWVALVALIKGRLAIEWSVPDTKKDKRLILEEDK